MDIGIRSKNFEKSKNVWKIYIPSTQATHNMDIGIDQQILKNQKMFEKSIFPPPKIYVSSLSL